MKNKTEQQKDITRKEALSKIGTYGKYAALTALGTYQILTPLRAQVVSGDDPGASFGGTQAPSEPF
jgi:hypothetical protein